MTLPIPPRSKTRGGAAYVDIGSGEPLVLIHGVGLRLEAWLPQIAALSADRRVIAIDMPGHGESERLADDDAPLETFVAWCGTALDDLGLAEVNLAGHSMGAMIAGGMAATFGQRIKRVALLNGVYRRDDQARAAVIARADAIRAGEIDYDGPLQRWFDASCQASEAYRLTKTLLHQLDPKGYATAYGAFARGDLAFADAWPTVAGPALFLTGEGDPNSTPAMAREMAAAAPAGTAEIIENHRHMVNLTAAQTVNRLLRDWLARTV